MSQRIPNTAPEATESLPAATARPATMRSSEARAIEYRRLAAEAAVRSDDSALDHVREKHRLSAESWNALAALNESLKAPDGADHPRGRTPLSLREHPMFHRERLSIG